MTKYQEFVKNNTPSPIMVPWEVLLQVASACGMEVVPVEDWGLKAFRFLSGDDYHLEFRGEAPMKGVEVRFFPRKGEGVLLYEKSITYSGERGYPHTSERLLRELESAGHVPADFKVAIPERVVTLPIPAWVEALNDDGLDVGSALPMFASEAKEAITDFIEIVEAMRSTLAS